MTMTELVLDFLIGLIVVSVIGITGYLIYQFNYHTTRLTLFQIGDIAISIFLILMLVVLNIGIICGIGACYASALNLISDTEAVTPLMSWSMAIGVTIFGILIAGLLDFFYVSVIRFMMHDFHAATKPTIQN